MENVETSVKIKCLIDMALRSEISWQTLDFLIDGLTPTLNKSKQIIKAMLKEFERHQSICQTKRSNDGFSEDVIEIDEDQYNDEIKTFQGKNSEEDRILITEQRKCPEEGQTNVKSEDMLHIDNEIDFLNVSDHNKSESNSCGAESENAL